MLLCATSPGMSESDEDLVPKREIFQQSPIKCGTLQKKKRTRKLFYSKGGNKRVSPLQEKIIIKINKL